jgi:alpha-tubulin suppressor-like RCC1 family protein
LKVAHVATALLALGLTLQLATSPTAAQAQTARDTLTLGRRAYERADFDGATRLLPIGLTAGGTRSDTLWVAGVHMLTDALLQQRKDTIALLWARWATRLTGGFPIDSTVYPPPVTSVLSTARARVGAPNPADTLINDAWDGAGESASGRGTLRLQRGGQSYFAVVEGLGTMLPGESRTVPAGTYVIRLTADGFVPLTISREVLPGYATVITPRLVRPGAVAAGAVLAPGAGSAPATAAPVIRGTTLAAAGATGCAVLEAGTVVCWGNNATGQLGSGVADSAHRTPVMVRGDPVYAAVSVASTHTCALTREGRAWCWGLGTSGELGNGQVASSATPVSVTGEQVFVQITTGAFHSCALSAAGAVFCWGANRVGTLGNRTSNPSAVPVSVAAPANVSFTALATGPHHSCALASNGSVYCWGSNNAGQLGNGSTADANAPGLVPSAVPFKAIAASGAHSCALTTGGSAYCWGANTSGQLGSGTTTEDSDRPVAVSGTLVLSSLAAGEAHTCGLTEDGAAYCWGAGRAGQLGTGQYADMPRPALVVGGHVFRTLAAGAAHVCALTDDRTSWCWGANNDGQLGSLAGRGTATPVPVLVRPATRSAGAGAPASLRESFADGNWTAGPAWSTDSASELRLTIADSALDVTRANLRGQVAGAGITIPVRIPVTRATQIQFDVMVRQGGMLCGLNCANYPAVVRLRVRNSDLTESEVWYAYGDRGGQNHSFGGVVIVARGDLTAGTWLREQRFTVRDALPRADTIVQVSLGGIGAEFGARFDNILLPVPVATTLDVTPDSVRITSAAPPTRLRATVREASGAEMPGTRITWLSSDTLIARVDSSGGLTLFGNGRAVIRARAGALADSTVVVVRLAPARQVRRAGGRPT